MPQSPAQILIHLVFSTKNRKVTFQEEYRRLLNKYSISFDECYVWD